MRPSLLAGFALAITGLLGTLPATAASVSGTTTATASVIPSCIITTMPSLAFGSYDPANANATQDLAVGTNIKLRCTQGVQPSLFVSQGQNPKSGSTCSSPKRQLRSSAGNVLSYSVYKYEGKLLELNCSSGYQVHSYSSKTDMIYSVNGVVYAGQDVPAGDYTDELTATFSF